MRYAFKREIDNQLLAFAVVKQLDDNSYWKMIENSCLKTQPSHGFLTLDSHLKLSRATIDETLTLLMITKISRYLQRSGGVLDNAQLLSI